MSSIDWRFDPMYHDINEISDQSQLIDMTTTHATFNRAELSTMAYSLDEARGARPYDGRRRYSYEFVEGDKVRSTYAYFLERMARYTRIGGDASRMVDEMSADVIEYRRASRKKVPLRNWRRMYRQLCGQVKHISFEPQWHVTYRGANSIIRSDKMWMELESRYNNRKIAIKTLQGYMRDSADKVLGYMDCVSTAEKDAIRSLHDGGMDDYDIDMMKNGYSDARKVKERQDAEALNRIIMGGDLPF